MKKLVVLAMAAMMTTAAVTGCGAAGGGKDIGKDEALEIALSDAGVHEGDTTRLRVSEDRDDGWKVYEIQFDAAGVEYEYEVAAEDGKILSAENEQVPGATNQNNAATQQNQTDVTQQNRTDDIKTDDNVQQNQANNAQTADGVQQNQANNAQTTDGVQQNQTNTVQNNGNNVNVKVSQQEAMAIALKRVPGATEKDIHIEFDVDDGQYRYEGDIIYDQKEYDFEIDANSGTILEWSEERR